MASIISQVKQYLEQHPKAASKKIAEDLGLKRSQVYSARNILLKKKRRDAYKKRFAPKDTTPTQFVPVMKYGEIVGVRSPDPEPTAKAEPGGWPAVWEAIKKAMRGEK